MHHPYRAAPAVARFPNRIGSNYGQNGFSDLYVVNSAEGAWDTARQQDPNLWYKVQSALYYKKQRREAELFGRFPSLMNSECGTLPQQDHLP